VKVAIHGDFCPENILLDRDSVWVIDFAGGERGAALHDLAYLYCHLDAVAAKPWVAAAGVKELQQALLRGFDPGLREEHPLFRLMLLRHTLCQMVVQRTSRWSAARRLYNRYLWSRGERQVLALA
jgi:Ser/Thr protein kinase RdoA (MazF antagonist)